MDVEQTAVRALKAKQLWMDWAEIFDAWRVVPRSILYSFGYWTIYIADRTLFWYFHLATADRTVQDAGLVTGVITAVTGVFGLTIKFYSTSGRQWTAQKTEDSK
jgi:hypothetical protein